MVAPPGLSRCPRRARRHVRQPQDIAEAAGDGRRCHHRHPGRRPGRSLDLRDNVLEDRKARVRELVLLAREIVDLDHQRAIKAGLSEDAAKEQAKDTLRHLRFDGDQFFLRDRQPRAERRPSRSETGRPQQLGRAATATASISPASSSPRPTRAAASAPIAFPASAATSRCPRSATASASIPMTGRSAPASISTMSTPSSGRRWSMSA